MHSLQVFFLLLSIDSLRGILELALGKAHSPLLLFLFEPFSTFLCLKLTGETSKYTERSKYTMIFRRVVPGFFMAYLVSTYFYC